MLAEEHRTLGNLALGLPPHMGVYLQAWIGIGQYGSIFDNFEDTLTFSHFQTFDFRGMDEQYPKVLEPLLFYIFQRISQIVYDPALRLTPHNSGRMRPGDSLRMDARKTTYWPPEQPGANTTAALA